jgi:hypothetical protein
MAKAATGCFSKTIPTSPGIRRAPYRHTEASQRRTRIGRMAAAAGETRTRLLTSHANAPIVGVDIKKPGRLHGPPGLHPPGNIGALAR